MNNSKLCIAILGPTASGKSSFAARLAEKIGGELVCMDSTTVYRGFDIGSSKPTAEEKKLAPHHLLDVLDPGEPFSAGHFVQLANDIIDDISSRNKVPIVVGGTYFYLKALQHGMYPTKIIPAEVIETLEKEFFEDEHSDLKRLHQELSSVDPEAGKAIHPNDRYRLIRALAVYRTTKELPSTLQPVPLSPSQRERLWVKYALVVSRIALQQNIVRRTESMIKKGIVEETKALWEKEPRARALQSIGYAECVQFLQKRLTEKQLRNEIVEKTRQLAKRQTTWLRSDPEVRYIDSQDLPRVQTEIENLQFVFASKKGTLT
jgi:tRNA dimethylallyltransferase